MGVIRLVKQLFVAGFNELIARAVHLKTLTVVLNNSVSAGRLPTVADVGNEVGTAHLLILVQPL